jgi:hypothetical protein
MYIYMCVCNIHLYLYVYWWIYVFVWLDHLTGVRGIFSELRAKATAWSLSHTDFWWIMMDHDAFLEFLHISPGFTFQTLQSMRIRAKQLRSGIPTHRPWCLRNAFEMPSNAIGCHRFYIQDVSMWIDQQGTQAHCITIRLLSKNAALPLHTLYFRVNSL